MERALALLLSIITFAGANIPTGAPTYRRWFKKSGMLGGKVAIPGLFVNDLSEIELRSEAPDGYQCVRDGWAMDGAGNPWGMIVKYRGDSSKWLFGKGKCGGKMVMTTLSLDAATGQVSIQKSSTGYNFANENDATCTDSQKADKWDNRNSYSGYEVKNILAYKLFGPTFSPTITYAPTLTPSTTVPTSSPTKCPFPIGGTYLRFKVDVTGTGNLDLKKYTGDDIHFHCSIRSGCVVILNAKIPNYGSEVRWYIPSEYCSGGSFQKTWPLWFIVDSSKVRIYNSESGVHYKDWSFRSSFTTADPISLPFMPQSWTYQIKSTGGYTISSRSPVTLAPTSSPFTGVPSSSPTTLSPITNSPSTSPSTGSPSTKAPSNSPTSISPTSCAPTTLSPTTLSPSTLSPSTLSPTTAMPSLSPSTMSPSTCLPSTSPSTVCPTKAPTTLSPVTITPTITEPETLWARLSDSMTGVVIKFQKPTSTPALTCEEFLLPESFVLFGKDPTCIWDDDRDKLIVYLDSGFTMRIGDAVQLKSNVVMDSMLLRYNTMQYQRIEPPLNQPPIRAILTGPESLGTCDSATIDATASMGAYGRQFTFEWSYQGSSLNMLKMLSTLKSGSFKLLPVNLTTGEHTFSVKVKNWVGGVSVTNITVRKNSFRVPTIRLPCPTTIQVWPSEELVIRAEVDPLCGGQGSVIKTKLRWSQLAPTSPYIPPSLLKYQGALTPYSKIEIPNPKTLYLFIAKHSFKMGRSYALQLRATFIQQGVFIGEANRTIIIHSKTLPVFAYIHGGLSRDVYIDDISFNSNFVYLNASESRDEGGKESLRFAWSVAYASNGSLVNGLLPTQNMSVLPLPASTLVPGHSYIIRLNVTTSDTGRTATTMQTLGIKRIEIPQIEASVFQGNSRVARNTFQRIKFNSEEEITFVAKIKDPSPPLFSSENVLTSRTNPVLTFSSNVFTPGERYTFEVTAIHAVSRGLGRASVEVQMNLPPAMGSCNVEPARGLSMKTEFRLSCNGWVDDDMPLRYSFRYAEPSWFPFRLCHFQYLPYILTHLYTEETSSVKLTGSISDALGVETSVSMSTFVESRPLNVTRMLFLMDKSLNETRFERFRQYIHAAAMEMRRSHHSWIDSGLANNTRSRLLSMVERFMVFQEKANASYEDRIQTPYTLLAEVSYSQSGRKAIDPEALPTMLKMIKTVLSPEKPEMRVKTVLPVVSTLGDIATFIASDKKLSNQERKVASAEIESLLLKASEVIEDDLVVDGSSREVYTPQLSLLAKVTSPQRIAGSKIYSKRENNSFYITIPKSFPNSLLDLTTPVSLVTFHSRSNTYPSFFAENTSIAMSLLAPISSTFGVKILQQKKSVVISNLSTPIELEVPEPLASAGLRSSNPNTTRCFFFNTSLGSWSTSGVDFAAMTSSSVKCNLFHLTTFAVRINTIQEGDVKAEAFSYENPMTLLLFIIIALFVLSFPITWAYDKKVARSSGQESSHDFWRMQNGITYKMTMESRSWENFWTSQIWAVRRRHPWISICFRHAGDYMDSRKRLLTLALIIFNGMATNALLIGQDQKLFYLSTYVSCALVTMLISFPVPYIFFNFVLRGPPMQYRISLKQSKIAEWVQWAILIVSLIIGDANIEIDAGDGDDVGDGADEGGGNMDDDDGAGGDIDRNEDAKVENQELNDDGQDDDGNAEEENDEDEKKQEYLNNTKIENHEQDAAQDGDNKEEENDKDEERQENLNNKDVLVGAAAAIVGTDFARERAEKRAVRTAPQPKRKQVQYTSILPGQLVFESSGANCDDTSLVNVTQKRLLRPPSKNREITLSRTKRLRRRRSSNMLPPEHAASVYHLKGINDDDDGDNGLDNKGCFAREHDPYVVNTHKWRVYDNIAAAALVVFVLGCTFLVIVLSYSLRERYGDWHGATATSLLFDILLRFGSITFMNSILTMPFLCFGAGVHSKNELHSRRDRKAVTTIVFNSGNDIGFMYERLRVADITQGCQAAAAGVKEGWRICSVNECLVHSDIECSKLLHLAHRTTASFPISFKTVEEVPSSNVKMVYKSDSLHSTNLSCTPISMKSRETSERTMGTHDSKVVGIISTITARNMKENDSLLSKDKSLTKSESILNINIPREMDTTTVKTTEENDSALSMTNAHPNTGLMSSGLINVNRKVDIDEGEKSGNESVSTTFSDLERRDMEGKIHDGDSSDDSEKTTFSELERRDMQGNEVERCQVKAAVNYGESAMGKDGDRFCETPSRRFDHLAANNSGMKGFKDKKSSGASHSEIVHRNHEGRQLGRKKDKVSVRSLRQPPKKNQRKKAKKKVYKEMPSVFQRLSSVVSSSKRLQKP
eukprot:jgi/Bigna1/90691/estExt_fgenesh1_pg.C_760099